jgi:hypothetical protein
MEDLNARMGALSLQTSSTDSLLARVARLPAELAELIYKKFMNSLLIKRARARETIRRTMIDQGARPGSAFGAPFTTRLGNAARRSTPWRLNVYKTLLRNGYVTPEQFRFRMGITP